MTKDDLDELRGRAREWLSTHLAPRPDTARERDIPRPEAQRLLADMHDAGLSGLSWPTEYGGAGLPDEAQNVVDVECRSYQMPTLAHVGVYFVAPTLLRWASHEQKLRYLPPMLRGEEVWCELFSEPGAGSDLASVRTTAVRDDDGWTITGQKVWTSGAHRSDFGFVLARADGSLPKHEGLAVLLVDLRQPGVTIRPLRQMTGASNFNEVFLDAVRTSPDALVGQVGDGWAVARTTLAFERAGIAARGGKRPGVVDAAELRTLLADRPGNDVVRADVVRCVELEMVARLMAQRSRSLHGVDPAAFASLMKIMNGRRNRSMAELALRMVGSEGIAWESDGHLAEAMANAPQYSIAGGTTEILLNLVGERGLGLPREPDPDRGRPFVDVAGSGAAR